MLLPCICLSAVLLASCGQDHSSNGSVVFIPVETNVLFFDNSTEDKAYRTVDQDQAGHPPLMAGETIPEEAISEEETEMPDLPEQITKEQLHVRLQLCRHAFGPDFTFAHRIGQDPSAAWQAKLALSREAAGDGHYRTLIRLNRIEDLRFPRPQRTPALLQRKLTAMVDSYDGTWSVYTKNLISGEEVIVHDRTMKSASVMKLFVMAAVYQAIADNELEKTQEVTSRLSSMISVSSNEDSNRLLELLGGGDYAQGISKVNRYIIQNGYSRRSHEYNGFQNDSMVLDPDHSNSVTGRDCSRLLESIYHRNFGSYTVCSEIEKFMLAQQTRYKIPAGIARVSGNILVGNKSGEMNQVENDVAIVYSPACDYTVCIFSSGWNNKDTAINRIQTLSEEICRYYNDEHWLKKTLSIPEILLDDSTACFFAEP